jgi:hypothetical protein
MRYVTLPDETVVEHRDATREQVAAGRLRLLKGKRTVVAEYAEGEWRSCAAKPPHFSLAPEDRDFDGS